MKKVICFFLACSLFIAAIETSFATSLRGDDEVELRKKGGVNGNGPKSPERIPIVCLLNESSQTISSSAAGSVGVVSIVVENVTTGTFYQDCFTLSHVMYLPEAGSYTVAYTTAVGDVYVGNFSL